MRFKRALNLQIPVPLSLEVALPEFEGDDAGLEVGPDGELVDPTALPAAVASAPQVPFTQAHGRVSASGSSVGPLSNANSRRRQFGLQVAAAAAVPAAPVSSTHGHVRASAGASSIPASNANSRRRQFGLQQPVENSVHTPSARVSVGSVSVPQVTAAATVSAARLGRRESASSNVSVSVSGNSRRRQSPQQPMPSPSPVVPARFSQGIATQTADAALPPSVAVMSARRRQMPAQQSVPPTTASMASANALARKQAFENYLATQGAAPGQPSVMPSADPSAQARAQKEADIAAAAAVAARRAATAATVVATSVATTVETSVATAVEVSIERSVEALVDASTDEDDLVAKAIENLGADDEELDGELDDEESGEPTPSA
jgi:hypothetical protein